MAKRDRPLTERQVELLSALYGGARQVNYPYGESGWMRPMDCGGQDATYHSAVLAQLVRKGLAERAERGGWWKPSWRYRITREGEAVYKMLTGRTALSEENEVRLLRVVRRRRDRDVVTTEV